MQDNKGTKNGFPDPLATPEEKSKKAYGIQYAKAIDSQWGRITDVGSLVGKRNRITGSLRGVGITLLVLRTLISTSNF
jgi:hypothetical protein